MEKMVSALLIGAMVCTWEPVEAVDQKTVHRVVQKQAVKETTNWLSGH